MGEFTSGMGIDTSGSGFSLGGDGGVWQWGPGIVGSLWGSWKGIPGFWGHLGVWERGWEVKSSKKPENAEKKGKIGGEKRKIWQKSGKN